ncbi:hypothetical protein [Halobellus marinus]|jgi:hypothetical protein|uniref:hypothetical protein n=1 Tax=Halobellus TaxID=1073986 RepID=UPI0028AFD2F9|nr:hypothetical protein [Halobellus sp. DFY28]
MANTPIDTIKQLLETAIKETDDREVHFKLRTASQLVDVVQQHHDDLLESLEDANLNDELTEELREMGYMD